MSTPVAAPPTSSADEPVTLTIGITDGPDSLSPFAGIEQVSFEMWQLTYDRLVGYSPTDMTPVPALATSWESSADGLTWTFHLTDQATWSDGQPLTAADVAYTYERIIDGGPEAATWGSYLSQVTAATAPDDTTVVLTLKKPNSSLPLVPIPIVPEHVWKDVDEKEVKTYANEPEQGQPVVGSGPFRLVEGGAGDSTYVFEANPDYWQGAPHVDRVVFRVYRSPDPLVQALIKGEVDFVDGINPLQVRSLSGRDGITAHNGNVPGFNTIGFNTGAVDPQTEKPIGDGNAALHDPAFRHALGYAIDVDQLVAKVFKGAGVAGSSIIPPTFPEWQWQPSEDQAYRYDPAKAAELLDEAGYTMGDNGLRTMPDGSPIGALRLAGLAESRESRDTMSFLGEWLGDIGIDSKVESVESSRLTQDMIDGTYDAFGWGWTVDPDPTTMLSYLTCDQRGVWSDTWYCDDDYEAMYAQQLVETDHDARVALVHRMQEQVYEDAPYLITHYGTAGEAFRSDRFACFVAQPDPDGVWLFQSGVASYLSVRPAAESADCDGNATATAASSTSGESEPMSTAAVVAASTVGAALVVLVVVVLVRRRRTSADRA